MRVRTILRGAVIAVAVFSAIMLAWAEGGLTPVAPGLFARADAGLDRVLAPVTDAITPLAIGFVRGWGLDAGRELASYWKHIFVLTWLFIATTGAATQRWPDAWIFNIVWGGVCALVAGVLAATMPLTVSEVRIPIAASLSLYGMAAWGWQTAFHSDYREWGIWDGLETLFFVALGLFLLLSGLIEPPSREFMPPEAKGLAPLAAMWVYCGVVFLLPALYDPGGEGDTRWSKWLTSPFTSASVTLLAVAFGAALLLAPAIAARFGA